MSAEPMPAFLQTQCPPMFRLLLPSNPMRGRPGTRSSHPMIAPQMTSAEAHLPKVALPHDCLFVGLFVRFLTGKIMACTWIY